MMNSQRSDRKRLLQVNDRNEMHGQRVSYHNRVILKAVSPFHSQAVMIEVHSVRLYTGVQDPFDSRSSVSSSTHTQQGDRKTILASGEGWPTYQSEE